MKYFSYKYATIIKDGKWIAYLPDFDVAITVGDDEEDIQVAVHQFVYDYIDTEYRKFIRNEVPVFDTPTASPLFTIINKTKHYLRKSELSIDHYIDNKEVVIRYDTGSSK